MKYFAGLSAGSKIISCQKFTTLDDMLTTVQNYKVYDCVFIKTFISMFFFKVFSSVLDWPMLKEYIVKLSLKVY